MGADDRRQRADQLRPRLEEATVDRSLRSIARQAGLSHATLSNFLQGATPSDRTLTKLERWLAEDGNSGQHRRAPLPQTGGDPDGSPAERLIYYFSHPETRRRFSDHPPMDFVKAAFAIALDEDFDQEELEKLGRWREEVRDRQAGDAPPTGD